VRSLDRCFSCLKAADELLIGVEGVGGEGMRADQDEAEQRLAVIDRQALRSGKALGQAFAGERF